MQKIISDAILTARQEYRKRLFPNILGLPIKQKSATAFQNTSNKKTAGLELNAAVILNFARCKNIRDVPHPGQR